MPFIIFSGGKKAPKFVVYLGEKLPYAIIGMLIVYCLRDVNVTQAQSVLPTLIAIAATAAIHIIKKNTVLSVLAGTAVYMLLNGRF